MMNKGLVPADRPDSEGLAGASDQTDPSPGTQASGAPSAARHWRAGRFVLPLSRTLVMGIVNVTPDSFSDGGRHDTPAQALALCEALVAQGADILDIGGESTRPGAVPPPAGLEMRRVMPVITQAVRLGVPVSVDTSDAEVMQAALEAGADIVNDVRALRRPGALATVAAHPSAGVVLMHMQGEPADMQRDPRYGDVVADVQGFLHERLNAALAAGLAAERLVLDPGFGFGKNEAQQLALVHGVRQLHNLGRPLLVGWSRKGMLGRLTGRAAHERLPASLAAALWAASIGASIVRVHDVAATVDALKIWHTFQPGGGSLG
jgi:dihydropteroate synthase